MKNKTAYYLYFDKSHPDILHKYSVKVPKTNGSYYTKKGDHPLVHGDMEMNEINVDYELEDEDRNSLELQTQGQSFK